MKLKDKAIDGAYAAIEWWMDNHFLNKNTYHPTWRWHVSFWVDYSGRLPFAILMFMLGWSAPQLGQGYTRVKMLKSCCDSWADFKHEGHSFCRNVRHVVCGFADDCREGYL